MTRGRAPVLEHRDRRLLQPRAPILRALQAAFDQVVPADLQAPVADLVAVPARAFVARRHEQVERVRAFAAQEAPQVGVGDVGTGCGARAQRMIGASERAPYSPSRCGASCRIRRTSRLTRSWLTVFSNPRSNSAAVSGDRLEPEPLGVADHPQHARGVVGERAVVQDAQDAVAQILTGVRGRDLASVEGCGRSR